MTEFTPEGAAAYAGSRAASGARQLASARLPGDRRYQGVIVAEFVAAVFILAVVPVAEGGSPNAKTKGSISPYDVTDLRQMVAVGMLYFILALLSSGNSGRLSAWFGGLVLVVLAMAKLAGGEFSAVVSNISGANASSSATSET